MMVMICPMNFRFVKSMNYFNNRLSCSSLAKGSSSCTRGDCMHHYTSYLVIRTSLSEPHTSRLHCKTCRRVCVCGHILPGQENIWVHGQVIYIILHSIQDQFSQRHTPTHCPMAGPPDQLKVVEELRIAVWYLQMDLQEIKCQRSQSPGIPTMQSTAYNMDQS